MVVVQTPEHVAAIPANIEISGLGRKDQGFHRQMGLKKTAMGLGLKQRQSLLFGRKAAINPGRYGSYIDMLRPLPQQLRHNLLHPRGAGFAIRADDNIIITEFELIPNG